MNLIGSKKVFSQAMGVGLAMATTGTFAPLAAAAQVQTPGYHLASGRVAELMNRCVPR